MWRCGTCQTVNPAGETACIGCAQHRGGFAAGDETRLRTETTPTPPITVGPAPVGARRPSPIAYAGLVVGGLVLVALISLVVVVVRGRGNTETAAVGATTSTTATTTTTPAPTVTVTVTVTIAPSSPSPNRPTTPPTTEAPYIPPAGVNYYPNVDPVNLRASPSLTARIFTRIPAGASLPAICSTRGDTLEGGGGGPNSDVSDNDIWIRTSFQGDDGWVTDAVMLTRGDSTNGTIAGC